jgi:hypothetical protein
MYILENFYPVPEPILTVAITGLTVSFSFVSFFLLFSSIWEDAALSHFHKVYPVIHAEVAKSPHF